MNAKTDSSSMAGQSARQRWRHVKTTTVVPAPSALMDTVTVAARVLPAVLITCNA